MTSPAPARGAEQYSHWTSVVDEQELRRLVDECQRALVEAGATAPTVQLQFQLQLTDGLSLVVHSLDEVLAEENPRHRSIKGLEINALAAGAEIVTRIGLG